MPIDPNSETSDVGQMYRQYLQSKGMPLTNENMQRVISQSQREPGMIAGLSVQQPDAPSAAPPPNVAGASASNSGSMPVPPMPPPSGIPASAPLPPQSLPHAPFPATSSAAPAPDILKSDPTPPPGQPPAPEQMGPPNPTAALGGPPASGLDNILAGLGLSGTAAYALKRMINGGDSTRPGSVPPEIAARSNVGAPSPVAAAMEKAIPSGLPGHQVAPVVNSGRSPLDAVDPVAGVRPVGPEIQGPPMGPPPMQGPPTGPRPMQGPPEAVTATSPIGNILKDKPTFAEGAQAPPWKGEGATVSPAESKAAAEARNYPGRTRMKGMRPRL